MKTKRHIAILGTRGVPAAHGGFETFAEHFALYLVDKGWVVTVYCQKVGRGKIEQCEWKGVNQVNVYVNGDSPACTILYDYLCVRHAVKLDAYILNLGYNTGFLNVFFRLSGHHTTINMDGLEWKRDKWSWPVKIWFFCNEILACKLGNTLIADHPEIACHLATRVNRRKIKTIAYGADDIVDDTNMANKKSFIESLGVELRNYFVVIARPVVENSIYEMVAAFSKKKRATKLIVLGVFDFENYAYHRKIKEIASDEVVFPGAIYDKDCVSALRLYSIGYMHGHKVGGTNPSLVESLGSGTAIIAHDNAFNRWVTNDQMLYFSTIDECSDLIQLLIEDELLRRTLQDLSKERFKSEFTWNKILSEYLLHFEELEG